MFASVALPMLFVVAWPTRHLGGKASIIEDVIRWTIVAFTGSVVMAFMLLVSTWVLGGLNNSTSGLASEMFAGVGTVILALVLYVPFWMNRKLKSNPKLKGIMDRIRVTGETRSTTKTTSPPALTTKSRSTAPRQGLQGRVAAAKVREANNAWLMGKMKSQKTAVLSLHPATRPVGVVISAAKLLKRP